MLEKCDFYSADFVFLSHTNVSFLFIIFLTKWDGIVMLFAAYMIFIPLTSVFCFCEIREISCNYLYKNAEQLG